MDLLDRYLNAVRLALFWRARREDIIDELRDDLLSRMEARQAELGRPLRDAEVEALLMANGHPLVAAARYRKHQSLIGPTILPFYEAGVAFLLVFLAAITLLQTLTSSNPTQALQGMVGAYISSAISMIGAATVIAVLLERFEVRLGFIENWRPRDLPRFDAPAIGAGGPGGAARRRRTSWLNRDKTRWESLWELVILLLFMCWWTRILPWPGVWRLGGHAGLVAVVSPIWRDLYWPILALAAVQAAAAALRFVQPQRTRAGAAMDLVSALAGLAVVAVLVPRNPWFELRGVGAGATPEQIAKLGELMRISFPICLSLAAVVWALQAFRALYHLVRGYEPPQVSA